MTESDRSTQGYDVFLLEGVDYAGKALWERVSTEESKYEAAELVKKLENTKEQAVYEKTRSDEEYAPQGYRETTKVPSRGLNKVVDVVAGKVNHIFSIDSR